MRWQELLHGEVSLHEVEVAEVGGQNASFSDNEELRLHFQGTEREIRLENSCGVFRVKKQDPQKWEALWNVWEGQRPFLVWLRASLKQTKASTVGQPVGTKNESVWNLTLQIHRFSRCLTWNEALHVGVDEAFMQASRKKNRSHRSDEEVLRWLSEEFCLSAPFDGPAEKNTESSAKEQTVRVIASGDAEKNKTLSLWGANFRAVLDLSKPLPSLKGLTAYQPPQGFSPPLSVLEMPLRFVDATQAGLERQVVRDALRQIADEAGSYLQLWQKYQILEEKLALQRAKRLGWLYYEKCEMDKEGFWRFQAEDTTENERFFEVQQKEEEPFEELEANVSVPTELKEANQEFQKKPSRQRSWGGIVVGLNAKKKEIVLRERLTDGSTRRPPPEKGYLSMALQGERTRFSRRQFALQRLHSAEAGIPQLSLMLEGLSCEPRKTKKERAFSAETSKIFGEQGPTPKQREAVDLAINTPDIMLIQGPPGTGKTKVLTAIQARLAEMIKDSHSLKGITLLSSYQHDAVDHAAGLSNVLGLPALRFGGKADEHSRSDLLLDRWVSRVEESLKSKLEEIPDSKLSRYRDLLDRSAFALTGGSPPEALRQLLEDILLAGCEANYETKEVLQNALRRLKKGKTKGRSFAEHKREQAVRGLFVESKAFKDGGGEKARRLLEECEDLLTLQEKQQLEEASKVENGHDFYDLAALQALQNRLLDHLLEAPQKAQADGLTEEEQQKLSEELQQMRNKILRTEQGERDIIESFLERLHTDPRGLRRLVESYATVYAATCQQSVANSMVKAKNWENWSDFSADKLVFENVLVDEAARANPLDLLIPMSLAKRRIILVGDQRQLPHLLEPEVEKELQRDIRGDLQKVYRESLFQRLFEELRRREKEDGIRRTITLNTQFRMHPRLGNWVSQQFYEPFREQFSSARPASDFGHGLEGYQTSSGRDRCAVWKDLPYADGPEKGGISKSRPVEAKWIAEEVKRLLQKEASLSIGVIAFYRAQVDALLHELEQLKVVERQENKPYKVVKKYSETENHEERLRIGTVDAFQGKEFDIVFLSIVRSNRQVGGDGLKKRKKYGHLMLENRLCVAMSRQRKLLIAVGDQAMFESDEAKEAAPALHSFLCLCEEDLDAR